MLARNQEVQDKLYEKIVLNLEEHVMTELNCLFLLLDLYIEYLKQGEINHEMILNFSYVDNVIHEILRMYPPAPRFPILIFKFKW